jgi:micrococcal nuclease
MALSASAANRTGWILSALMIVIIAVFVAWGQGQQTEEPLSERVTASSASSSSFSSIGVSTSNAQGSGVTVTRVIDGDTVEVSIAGMIEKVRIVGIDAPEKNPKECFADEATTRLTQLILGRNVALQAKLTEDRDAFDRLLRYVHSGSTDIGLLLVREGLVMSYEKYPHPLLREYEAAEVQATSARTGLWGSCSISASSATAVKTGAPQGCDIKGNINADGKRIYHLATCPFYGRTLIDASTGERWFCTEAEAKAAGWLKAGNCP